MKQLNLFDIKGFVWNEIKKKCYLCNNNIQIFQIQDSLGINYWHHIDNITIEICQASEYIKQLHGE
jgi:hypothetical protein